MLEKSFPPIVGESFRTRHHVLSVRSVAGEDGAEGVVEEVHRVFQKVKAIVVGGPKMNRWGISLRQLETDQCGSYLSISFMFLTITISSKCNAADDQIEAVTGEGEVDFDVALRLFENCMSK
nr:hypothetical protein Iba_chr15bCG10870 [Ipomoea batatas]